MECESIQCVDRLHHFNYLLNKVKINHFIEKMDVYPKGMGSLWYLTFSKPKTAHTNDWASDLMNEYQIHFALY